ncbi:MAG: cation transporter [bacterium]
MKSIRTYLGILALGILVIVLIILVPGYIGQNPTTNTISPRATDSESLRVAEIELPGMFCPSCAWSAESAFKGMDGVVDAKVDFGTKKGTVIYESSTITKEELIQDGLIQAYDGKVLNDQKYSP